MEDDKKLAWVVDEGGNVHANSEMLLLREMESTLRNDEVSSLLLSSFEDVFLVLLLSPAMFRSLSIERFFVYLLACMF